MDSVRGFFRIWIAVALVLIAYSVVDLRLNPWLHHESYFSMRPDWSRLPGPHALGRAPAAARRGVALDHERALISGAVALLVQSVFRIVKRLRSGKH